MVQFNEHQGQRRLDTALDPNIALKFFVEQILNNVQTACLVKVVEVTNSGGIEPVGMVDVVPLVQQLTGAGEAVSHGTIYKLPYLRVQGGRNAIIIDPEVGDIGICVFCNRDSSAVKATRKEGPPSSARTFNWADGMYFGGFLNAAPEQYIQFSTEGIHMVSPAKITLQAPDIELLGPVTANGTIMAQGDISSAADVKAGTISLKTHVHGGVSSGGSNTGSPA